MKKLSYWSIVALFLFCIAGCDKTGYRINIAIESMSYSDVKQIETILKEKNFKLGTYLDEQGGMNIWLERKVDFPKYPAEVYTYLSKKMGEKKYAFVQVYINYVKNSSPVVNHVEIRVENMYAGLIIPEIKTEIDSIGTLLYQELINKIGRENVRLERKEVSPPQFY